MTKAAVIGVGAIARQHLLCLRDLPGVEVVAVCDRSPAVAEAACERFGVAAAYTDHRALLAATAPDVVHVTTPVNAHLPIALDALDAGAHVVVEKPITASYADTRELIARAERDGLMLVENYNYVFNPELQEVLRLARSGELGDVTHVEVDLAVDILGPGSPFTDAAAPHPSASMPGGAIADFLPHLASLVHYLVGGHRDVRTIWTRRPGSPLEADELRALVSAERGSAAISFSALAQPDAFRLSVHGTRMRAHVNLFEPRLSIERLRELPGPLVHLLNGLDESRSAGGAAVAGLWRKLAGRPTAYSGLWALLARTYEAVASGGAAPVSLAEIDAVNRLVADLTRDEQRL
jgi:predicted dehydrogenase